MHASSAHQPFSKDRPFEARLTHNRLLTGAGSAKETRHLVINLEGSGLTYEAGDSLGVFPVNRPSDVERFLAVSGLDPTEQVQLPRHEGTLALGEALREHLALAGPTPKMVEALAQAASDPAEREHGAWLLDPEQKEALGVWLHERDIADVVEAFPSARLSAGQWVGLMRRLMPRLYSIASSPRAHPQEVHLTVAIVRYQTLGRDRVGVCSTYMADRVELGRQSVRVFVSSSHFRPPEDTARDMILVGPGTGIAPFRAFLQDKAAKGGTGRAWLFFGDQRRATDFLYEEEWKAYLESGVLTRMDTAFSRDQAQKIYVQDRMREQGAALWEWIHGGAAFYVCGDAKRMAKDVDLALHGIIERHGNLTPAEAVDFVKVMKKEKRYQRDVY